MNHSIKSILNKYDKLKMTILPVPIHRLNKLSNLFNVNLYCLRDDLNGFAFGGNKIRKLDYLIKDAINKGCDSVVTWGSNQSNWCRMTAVAGSVNGLNVHLILQGKKPSKPTANLKLAHLSGARIEHIECDEDEVMIKATQNKLEQLKGQGKKPYNMVLGGSNSLGSLGYLEVFQEILDYSERSGVLFTKIIHASGSGGTQTGLVMGKTLSNWEGKIIGMNASRCKQIQEEKVWNLLQEMGDFLEVKVLRSMVINDDNYYGVGYRINTLAAKKAIELFSHNEGVFLDEVYTGKAAAGLIDYIKKGLIIPEENILFIHTGGNVQLFE